MNNEEIAQYKAEQERLRAERDNWKFSAEQGDAAVGALRAELHRVGEQRDRVSEELTCQRQALQVALEERDAISLENQTLYRQRKLAEAGNEYAHREMERQNAKCGALEEEVERLERELVAAQDWAAKQEGLAQAMDRTIGVSLAELERLKISGEANNALAVTAGVLMEQAEVERDRLAAEVERQNSELDAMSSEHLRMARETAEQIDRLRLERHPLEDQLAQQEFPATTVAALRREMNRLKCELIRALEARNHLFCQTKMLEEHVAKLGELLAWLKERR